MPVTAELIAGKIDALSSAVLDALPDVVALAPTLQAAAVKTAALLKEIGGLLAEYQLARAGVGMVRGLPDAARFAADRESVIETLAQIIAETLDIEYERALAIVQRALGNVPLVADAQTMALAKTIRTWFDAAQAEGLTLGAFQKLGKLPGLTKANLEAEFRTELQQRYGQQGRELVKAAGAAVPFLRWVTVNDDRVRPTHKAMHNYIAATSDPIWTIWKVPAGYSCRCILVGIPYLSAIRMGIAARTADGKGLILPKGPRPFGPPPRFVSVNGKLIAVRPDPGFEGTAAEAAA